MYILGLEARIRHNIYEDLDDAINSAKYIASVQSESIRIYKHDKETKKSELFLVAHPDGVIAKKALTNDLSGGYGTFESLPPGYKTFQELHDKALETVTTVPVYQNLWKEHGMEWTMRHYIVKETEYDDPDYVIKMFKKVK